MKRFCLALDLKDDANLIAEYEAYHRQVWPEILESIATSGITSLQIYRVANRLFMIMDTVEDFSFERKAAKDAANPRVQDWETLMWNYQQALPTAKPGEKWMLMDKIFDWQG
jgi:L-rhamnose mutarotase